MYKFTDEHVESGTTYFYRLQDIQSNGVRHESDIIRITPALPEHFALLQNYPNPFNPSTTIRFDIADPSYVSLAIYDILGRQVRTMISGEIKPGFHKIEWNGRNANGEMAASGLYHLVLDCEGGRFVKKMVLVR